MYANEPVAQLAGDVLRPKARALLVNAANYVLRESSPDNAVKRFGMRICARGGKVAKRKAKTAVARKLAVVMLAMLKSGKPYDDALAARFEVAA